MVAWRTWLDAKADCFTHAEAPPQQRVDVDPTGQDIATRLSGGERDSGPGHHALDPLRGDERDVGPGDAKTGVSVTNDSCPGFEHCLIELDHRGVPWTRWVHVDRLDGALLTLGHSHDRPMIRAGMRLSPT